MTDDPSLVEAPVELINRVPEIARHIAHKVEADTVLLITRAYRDGAATGYADGLASGRVEAAEEFRAALLNRLTRDRLAKLVGEPQRTDPTDLSADP